jgi:hypothetical protein
MRKGKAARAQWQRLFPPVDVENFSSLERQNRKYFSFVLDRISISKQNPLNFIFSRHMGRR